MSRSRLFPNTGSGWILPIAQSYQRRRAKRSTTIRLLTFVGLTTLVLVYLSVSPRHHQYDEVDGSAEANLHRRLLQLGDENNELEANGSITLQTAVADDPLFPPELFTIEQLKQGAVILHIIGILYMFYALALVCDEFFVPSLDVIAENLGISPDVAGATFMAAGGSAPELFTSVIGVFIAKSDVGIGTIVGSAVFNILFVIAACAFAAKDALSLTAWPLVRDVFFYSVSLIVLVLFFLDEEITWYEALILFLWYGAYVGFMKFNESVEDAMRKLFQLPPIDRTHHVRGVTLRSAHNRKGLFHLMNETINPGILRKTRTQNSRVEGDEDKPLNKELPPGGLMIGDQAQIGGGISQLKTHLQDQDGSINFAKTPSADTELMNISNGDEKNKEIEETNAEEDEEQEGEDPIDMSFPMKGGWKAILVYLISFPIMFPLFLTLPDTKNPAKRKFFPITFVGSIIWVAAYSYLMVWWATTAGNTLGIPSDVMGLTFLAAGTSVPDLITSVLVAQQGKGDMAVSSSVGSNIFDVTVGLPVPWLIYTLINGRSVEVSSSGVGCSVAMLFLMLILVFLSIVAFRWKMTKGMGLVMLVLYFIFVIASLGFSNKWYSCPI